MAKIDKIEKYQAAVDEAISLCDGDVRGALAALVAGTSIWEGFWRRPECIWL